MATTSAKSIRIRNILGIDVKDFNATVNEIASSTPEKLSRLPWKSSLRSPSAKASQSSPEAIITSLAKQQEHLIATVTFRSPDFKSKALKTSSSKWNPAWIIDDAFNGVTTLYSPAEAEVDICTVHGLGGNAFDTWADNKSTMWPRDMLPDTGPFRNSRVMTFGYSSQLKDRGNTSGVIQWADHLLAQIGSLRRRAEERQRPIIFVCHSLGGLVAREAMIRLNAHPERYEGIRIENCGLLFLGTPHSGTVQADWNGFIDGLLAVGGIRSELLKELKSFNEFSVESKDAFASIAAKPPYFCIHETRMVKVAGMQRFIVTRDSAGLNDVAAVGMPDVDHREMCRFSNKFHDGYILIVERLTRLRRTLMLRTTSVVDESDGEDKWSIQDSFEAPGHPSITAPRWSLPVGRHYYEGKELLDKSRLCGRLHENQDLEDMITELLDTDSDYTAISISGIGGIGKTELLLNLAYQHREQYNIFFLNAQDNSSLEDAYLFIANDLWSEILASRHPQDDRYRIWQALPRTERIDLFKRWLGTPENENTFILFDDIDGLQQENITDAIPARAKNVIITTRNPGLMAALGNARGLRFRHLGVADMTMEDMVNYTCDSLKELQNDNEEAVSFTEDQALAISKAAAGHPLLASRAVSYIMTDLVEQYDTSAIDKFIEATKAVNLEERKALLSHKPPLQSSMMENFSVSRTRLTDQDGPAWTLMKLLAFLSLEDGGFHGFIFHPRPWMHELKDILTFYDIWSAKNNQLRAWMVELVQVSLAWRRKRGGFLRFHPVTIQCVQMTVAQEERIRILRDILILAYESVKRSESQASSVPDHKAQSLYAQALYCESIQKIWQISEEALDLPDAVTDWLHSNGTIPEIEESPVPHPIAPIVILEEPHKNSIVEDLLDLQTKCQNVKSEFSTLHETLSNQDAFQRGRELMSSLFQSLKDIDEQTLNPSGRERAAFCNEYFIACMEEVYEELIHLARSPILHNQMLPQHLSKKRVEAISRLRALGLEEVGS